MGNSMSRILMLGVALLAITAGTAQAKPVSWAAPQIRTLAAAGLMGAGKNVAAFRPADPLTAQTLEDVVFELKQRFAEPEPEPEPEPLPVDPTLTDPTVTEPAPVEEPAPPVAAPKQVANPARQVQMWELDARLVGALGLADAASTFAKSARAAGLKVPSRFGTEVVARLLGLRLNHPATEDSLELRPQDVATRAEAAYSVAQVLGFSGWEIENARAAADAFALPELTAWQVRILTAAVAHIGMPYIWGGETDGAQTAFGVPSRGGYDCSGFVWRVYKLQWYPGAGPLASTLRGRTTYVMSGEVARAKRIGLQSLQPADVVFFGSNGPRSQPSQVDHMGIYLGNGWFIHSSSYGVALATLDGWYRRSFAWGRRPLAEAGLS
jgi:cell wall-associated NlpC family hydrolase